jgi:DNA repair exonuclease SbcCD ATPase subunit
MTTTSVQTQKELLERIRTRLIKLGEIDDFAQELFQLLNVAQPENPEITRLKREVSQLRQHKNEYMEAATETAGALEREIVELKSLIVDIGADPVVLNMNDALTERMQAVLCRRTATTAAQPVKMGRGS